MTKKLVLLLFLTLFCSNVFSNEGCANVSLSILGSGGPELDDGRNSSGYAIVVKGEPLVLVETGTGTARAFEEKGYSFEPVKGILISHFHVDHVNDLAAYVKGAFFTSRIDQLVIAGPRGNEHLPGAVAYVNRLIDKSTGLYPYMHKNLPEHAGKYDLKIAAQAVSDAKEDTVRLSDSITAESLPTTHGPLKSVAWRVNIESRCRLVFMGDTGIKARDNLATFAKNADLLVLHMPLEIDAPKPAYVLHMAPRDLALIVKQAKPKKTVLSHFMKRSLRNLEINADVVRNAHSAKLILASDGLDIPLD